MKKRFTETEGWKWLRTLIEILVIAAVVWLAIALYTSLGFANAEELYDEGYVLCTDYVNVRRKPSTKSASIGTFECGEHLYLDGKKKNGFLHCVDLMLEENEGWIHSGFVVSDKPERVWQKATIVSKGRLAARKYVNGKRTRWLKPLASVTVYYWSDEWAVTDCGYVMTQYLELEGE